MMKILAALGLLLGAGACAPDMLPEQSPRPMLVDVTSSRFGAASADAAAASPSRLRHLSPAWLSAQYDRRFPGAAVATAGPPVFGEPTSSLLACSGSSSSCIATEGTNSFSVTPALTSGFAAIDGAGSYRLIFMGTNSLYDLKIASDGSRSDCHNAVSLGSNAPVVSALALGTDGKSYYYVNTAGQLLKGGIGDNCAVDNSPPVVLGKAAATGTAQMIPWVDYDHDTVYVVGGNGELADYAAGQFRGYNSVSSLTRLASNTVTVSSPIAFASGLWVGDDRGALFRVPLDNDGTILASSSPTKTDLCQSVTCANNITDAVSAPFVDVSGKLIVRMRDVLASVDTSCTSDACTVTVGGHMLGAGSFSSGGPPVVDVSNGWAYVGIVTSEGSWFFKLSYSNLEVIGHRDIAFLFVNSFPMLAPSSYGKGSVYYPTQQFINRYVNDVSFQSITTPNDTGNGDGNHRTAAITDGHSLFSGTANAFESHRFDFGASGTDCVANAQCLSRNCTSNKCLGAAGESCGHVGEQDCADGTSACVNNRCLGGVATFCLSDADCASPVHCSNGLCGGAGAACTMDEHCVNTTCASPQMGDNTICIGAQRAACSNNEECRTGEGDSCYHGVCGGEVGAYCFTTADCAESYCHARPGYQAVCGEVGAVCGADSQCQYTNCYLGQCGRTGATCNPDAYSGADCVSGYCDGSNCVDE